VEQANALNRIGLSKSRLLSSLQCRKRLWLEVRQPELAGSFQEGRRAISAGHEVGEVARTLYPGGILVSAEEDVERVLEQSRDLVASSGDITLFEPAFEHRGVLIRADVLRRRRSKLRLIEVKGATTVKPYYLSDVAIQYWVLKGAGLEPDSVAIAHVNRGFVYPGGGDYRGLLRTVNVTAQVRKLQSAVPRWIRAARRVLAGDLPAIETGPHCDDPYPCPFVTFCGDQNTTEFPITLLPYGGKLVQALHDDGYRDLRDVPGDRLTSDTHLRIWRATLSGEPEVDAAAAAAVEDYAFPRFYLDFETISFAVPIWAGTRPYQQLPFQWSCHIEQPGASMAHRQYLDTSGSVPLRGFAESLIGTLGRSGPVFVYSAFESTRLGELASMLPECAAALERIRRRLVDLHPLVRRSYYHPAMRGSFSMKAILPVVAPELDYGLPEVQNGGMAQEAYLESIHADTSPERRQAIRSSLLEYCRRDTLGLVRVLALLDGAARAR
jgi:hypothetical protein